MHDTFSCLRAQGHREVVVGRVDHVDGRDGDRAPVPAGGAAAAGAQRRAAAALALRLPAPEDRWVSDLCVASACLLPGTHRKRDDPHFKRFSGQTVDVNVKGTIEYEKQENPLDGIVGGVYD